MTSAVGDVLLLLVLVLALVAVAAILAAVILGASYTLWDMVGEMRRHAKRRREQKR